MLSNLLGLRRCLGATLIAAALTASAQGQSSVTLAWDPSPSSGVAGYRVYEGIASRTYTNVIDAANAMTQTVTGLAGGVTYFFAFTAYDTNGLESDYSSEVSYTVPLPAIALTSPANGRVYMAPATIPLAASVIANGHTITKVQFYNGATLLGEAPSPPYSFIWSSVSAGSYFVTALTVYDTSNTLSSVPADIAVTDPFPGGELSLGATSGTITAPFVASGDTVYQTTETTLASSGRAAYSFAIVNAGDYLVSANVDAPNEGANSFFVNIDDEPTDPYMIWHIPVTTNLQSRTVSWQGNGTWENSEFVPKVFTLNAGTHQLIVRGREGNTKLGTITISPATNSIPPIVALTSPANGASYTAPATVEFVASVTANGHPVDKVQFYDGAMLLGEVTSAPYSFIWSNVSAGSYSLSAQAVYDASSTVGSSSINVTVTNPPPAVALTSPANGTSYTAPATVEFVATVTANGHPVDKVQFYDGAMLLGEVTSAPYSFIWSNVSAGNYSLSAQAVYDAGRTVASSSINVTVTNPPPTVALTSPANGTSYTAPATVELVGTVTANGHLVDKVQFYDGAMLLGEVTSAPYSFIWSDVSAGSYSLSASLVYDAGSTIASSSVGVTVAPATVVVTLWPSTAVPGVVDAGPDSAVELGVKFRSDVAGSITGIRFYKGSANTGAHVGNLWTSTGTLLATATFTDETASGWQQVNFATPVAITANTVYVASYHVNNGHYSADDGYFSVNGVDNPPLHALADGVSGGNGVHAYGSVSAFPNQTWKARNYWVDVVWQGQLAPALPAPWQTAEIGSVGAVGSASLSNGLCIVKGAGNISGTADNFRFVYQPLSGDGEIKARLNSVEDTGTSGRVGVMIRESLTSGSRYAFMGISPDGTFRWRARLLTGGSTWFTNSTIGTPPNVWTRLVRTGDTLRGYNSTDGTNWTLLSNGDITITMATNIYIGLAVASGTSNVLNSSTFTNVKVIP